MFLDDELYQKAKSFQVGKPEDFVTLVNELYKICDTYYKAKLPPLVGCSYKEVTQIMDTTFKFWDLFIQRIEKENWWIADILKRHSYKEIFMSNEGLKELYDKGK